MAAARAGKENGGNQKKKETGLYTTLTLIYVCSLEVNTSATKSATAKH